MSRQLDKQVNASLQTILDAANDLITEVGIPATAIDLIEGPRIVQIAFCECIRRAGEAVFRIDALVPGQLNETFPGVPWRDIKATRNMLTHHYWSVDYEILYSVATTHLAAVTTPVAAHLGTVDPYRP